MLLDLHQHLKEQLQHKNLTWENAFPTPTSTITANTMTNLSELEKRVSELTTTDKTAEPELTQSLRDEIHQHSKKAKATRLFNANHTTSYQTDTALELPVYFNYGEHWRLYQQPDNPNKPWMIDITLPETLLQQVCGEWFGLNIDVFLYRGNARTRIPSDIIDEQLIEKDNQQYTKFTLELETLITDALDFKITRGMPNPLAGFTGKEGEGVISIVFDTD